MLNKLTNLWVAKDGSIFLQEAERVKLDTNQVIHVQQSIAFNVGSTAEHIVRLHNESLNVESEPTRAR